MADEGSPGLAKRLGIERRRIAAQHERLGELWRSFLEPFESGVSDVARSAFENLFEGVTAHFEVEERVHIPALHGANPAVSESLQEIVAEHRRFLDELERIAEALASSEVERAGAMVEALIRQFADHEAREEKLFDDL